MQLVGLNPEEHGDLHVRAAPPEDRRFVEIVADEFAAAAACCPILFVKNAETGAFYAGAMFGFAEGEPLTAGDAGQFVPLDRKRAGFFISGDHIAIDEQCARFSRSEGEPLFHADGSPAPALRAIQAVLTQLHRGKAETDAFIRTMLDLKLIEPISVSLKFDDGQKLELHGLYTIGLDGLAELDDASVVSLFRSGHLQLAYTVALSARQIPLMAARHNARLSAGPPGA
ncbi:MAG TPA: SapC family protein [Croceibacterium sp.]|nr:SapC family protein [Croceibacterium sp.]